MIGWSGLGKLVAAIGCTVLCLIALDEGVAFGQSLPGGAGCPARGGGFPTGPVPAGQAALVPAGAVSVTLCRYRGLNDPDPRYVNELVSSITIADPGELQSLTDQFNTLPTTGPGVGGTGPVGCPADDGSSLAVVFSYPSGAPDPVVVQPHGCSQATNGLIRVSMAFAPGPQLVDMLQRRAGCSTFMCDSDFVGEQSASIQAVLQADGQGEMLANSQTNPVSETWSWLACGGVGASDCRQYASGRSARTAGAGPGTVFVAVASDGPTATSPVWHGQVMSSSAPTVRGHVRANALVTPAPGNWSGGWDGDFDQTQLAACVHADGTDCTTLTDPHYLRGCRAGAAVIDPIFAGRYLRVADRRWGVGTAFAAVAATSPYSHRPWGRGSLTSVAVVGRIARATGPRTVHCGPPPLPPNANPRNPIARANLSGPLGSALRTPKSLPISLS